MSKELRSLLRDVEEALLQNSEALVADMSGTTGIAGVKGQEEMRKAVGELDEYLFGGGARGLLTELSLSSGVTAVSFGGKQHDNIQNSQEEDSVLNMNLLVGLPEKLKRLVTTVAGSGDPSGSGGNGLRSAAALVAINESLGPSLGEAHQQHRRSQFGQSSSLFSEELAWIPLRLQSPNFELMIVKSVLENAQHNFQGSTTGTQKLDSLLHGLKVFVQRTLKRGNLDETTLFSMMLLLCGDSREEPTSTDCAKLPLLQSVTSFLIVLQGEGLDDSAINGGSRRGEINPLSALITTVLAGVRDSSSSSVSQNDENSSSSIRDLSRIAPGLKFIRDQANITRSRSQGLAAILINYLAAGKKEVPKQLSLRWKSFFNDMLLFLLDGKPSASNSAPKLVSFLLDEVLLHALHQVMQQMLEGEGGESESEIMRNVPTYHLRLFLVKVLQKFQLPPRLGNLGQAVQKDDALTAVVAWCMTGEWKKLASSSPSLLDTSLLPPPCCNPFLLEAMGEDKNSEQEDDSDEDEGSDEENDDLDGTALSWILDGISARMSSPAKRIQRNGMVIAVLHSKKMMVDMEKEKEYRLERKRKDRAEKRDMKKSSALGLESSDDEEDEDDGKEPLTELQFDSDPSLMEDFEQRTLRWQSVFNSSSSCSRQNASEVNGEEMEETSNHTRASTNVLKSDHEFTLALLEVLGGGSGSALQQQHPLDTFKVAIEPESVVVEEQEEDGGANGTKDSSASSFAWLPPLQMTPYGEEQKRTNLSAALVPASSQIAARAATSPSSKHQPASTETSNTFGFSGAGSYSLMKVLQKQEEQRRRGTTSDDDDDDDEPLSALTFGTATVAARDRRVAEGVPSFGYFREAVLEGLLGENPEKNGQQRDKAAQWFLGAVRDLPKLIVVATDVEVSRLYKQALLALMSGGGAQGGGGHLVTEEERDSAILAIILKCPEPAFRFFGSTVIHSRNYTLTQRRQIIKLIARATREFSSVRVGDQKRGNRSGGVKSAMQQETSSEGRDDRPRSTSSGKRKIYPPFPERKRLTSDMLFQTVAKEAAEAQPSSSSASDFLLLQQSGVLDSREVSKVDRRSAGSPSSRSDDDTTLIGSSYPDKTRIWGSRLLSTERRGGSGAEADVSVNVLSSVAGSIVQALSDNFASFEPTQQGSSAPTPTTPGEIGPAANTSSSTTVSVANDDVFISIEICNSLRVLVEGLSGSGRHVLRNVAPDIISTLLLLALRGVQSQADEMDGKSKETKKKKQRRNKRGGMSDESLGGDGDDVSSSAPLVLIHAWLTIQVLFSAWVPSPADAEVWEGCAKLVEEAAKAVLSSSSSIGGDRDEDVVPTVLDVLQVLNVRRHRAVLDSFTSERGRGRGNPYSSLHQDGGILMPSDGESRRGGSLIQELS